MSTLEIFATLFTLICVWCAVKLKIAQYPIGIIGTILYFFVFWNAQLYFSAWLQVFFTIVQFYGWWYWSYGDKGKEPKITVKDYAWFIIVLALIPFGFGIVAAYIAEKTTDTQMPLADAYIFGASVLAQWYLDRKVIQTWIVWLLVNIVSIVVYFNQGLTLTGWLYVVFLFNTFWGFYSWNKQLKIQNNE